MHVTVLTILAVAGCVRLFQGHWEILQFNWDLPSNINTAADIFFGFCVAMLGVTYVLCLPLAISEAYISCLS
jgi:hypothetical protein